MLLISIEFVSIYSAHMCSDDPYGPMGWAVGQVVGQAVGRQGRRSGGEAVGQSGSQATTATGREGCGREVNVPRIDG